MQANVQHQSFRLPGGEQVTVRPACPQDAEIIQAYIRGLSPASRYARFLGTLSELSPRELERTTHPDQPAHMSLIVETVVDGTRTMIGEARWRIAPDGLGCELAGSVADGWRGRKLGTWLLDYVTSCIRRLGVRQLAGDVLHANQAALSLARKAGFRSSRAIADARLVRLTKDLSATEGARAA
jgi:acetyltransferase